MASVLGPRSIPFQHTPLIYPHPFYFPSCLLFSFCCFSSFRRICSWATFDTHYQPPVSHPHPFSFHLVLFKLYSFLTLPLLSSPPSSHCMCLRFLTCAYFFFIIPSIFSYIYLFLSPTPPFFRPVSWLLYYFISYVVSESQNPLFPGDDKKVSVSPLVIRI